MSGPLATASAAFRLPIEQALASGQELLVLARYSRAAGRRDWWLVHTPTEFHSLLAVASPSASVSVFLGPELPIGVAHPEMVAPAQALLEAEGEVLCARLPTDGSRLEEAAGIDDTAELAEWLQEQQGAPVAIGRYPPFWLEDPAVVLSAYVPDGDGIVRPGVY